MSQKRAKQIRKRFGSDKNKSVSVGPQKKDPQPLGKDQSEGSAGEFYQELAKSLQVSCDRCGKMGAYRYACKHMKRNLCWDHLSAFWRGHWCKNFVMFGPMEAP